MSRVVVSTRTPVSDGTDTRRCPRGGRRRPDVVASPTTTRRAAGRRRSRRLRATVLPGIERPPLESQACTSSATVDPDDRALVEMARAARSASAPVVRRISRPPPALGRRARPDRAGRRWTPPIADIVAKGTAHGRLRLDPALARCYYHGRAAPLLIAAHPRGGRRPSIAHPRHSAGRGRGLPRPRRHGPSPGRLDHDNSPEGRELGAVARLRRRPGRAIGGTASPACSANTAAPGSSGFLALRAY